jgi:hypothetical protein
MRFAPARRHRRTSVIEPARFLSACTLTATPQVGVPVGVTLGTPYGSGSITYAYQWKLDGSDIGAATSATYTPLTGDATHTLTCTVTPSGSGGTASGGSKTTTGIAVLAGAPSGGAVAAPTLTGSPTLIASWDFGDDSKLTLSGSYVSAIAGSDGTAYTLSQATAALRPERVIAGGYGAAKFTGAQVLALASSLGRSQSDSITVVVVMEQLQEDSEGTIFCLATNATAGRYQRHKLQMLPNTTGSGLSGPRYIQAGNVTEETVERNTAFPLGHHLIVGAGGPSPTTNKIYVDAAANVATGTSTFGPSGTQTTGSNLTSTALGADQDSDFFTGLVWRFLIYAGQVSSTNVTELAAWKAAAWGGPTTVGTMTEADIRLQPPSDGVGDGYKVYYSQTPWGTDNAVTLSGLSTTSTRITGLTSGTWYFYAAVTNGATESEMIPIKEQTVA